MEITQEEEAGRGHLLTTLDGHPSKLVYERSGKTMVVEHVKVASELEGRGVGTSLVQRAVEIAREEGWQLVPVCPFAKAQMEKNIDWQDVLKAPGAR